MNQLKETRLERKMTQKDMAEKIGIPEITYRMYEAGDRSVPEDKAEKISKILGKNVEDLFTPERYTVA